MPPKVGASVSNPGGFADLIASMSRAGSESTLRQAAAAGATVIRKEVVVRAPVGTIPHTRSGKEYPPGTLKKNILVYHASEKSSAAGGVGAYQTYGVVIGSDAFYGRIVENGHPLSGYYAKHLKATEYGSSTVAAKPFFRPAVDAKKTEALDAMTAVMQKTLDEAKNG